MTNPLIRLADTLTEDILNLSEHEVLMDLCAANCVVPVRPQLIDALLKRFPEIRENGDALIHSQDIGKTLLAEIKLAVRVLDALDPPCTGCNGTGINFQTERRCQCQPPMKLHFTNEWLKKKIEEDPDDMPETVP